MPIDPPAPEQRQHDEHAAVGRIHTTKVHSSRLQCWENSVQEENEPAERTEADTTTIAKPEPHEVATADLAEASEEKERDGGSDAWQLSEGVRRWRLVQLQALAYRRMRSSLTNLHAYGNGAAESRGNGTRLLRL